MTACCEAEFLAEEWELEVLKPVGHGAGMRARINLKTVGNSAAFEDIVQLAGINAQAVLAADVHRREIEIQRRVLRIGGPGRIHGKLCNTEAPASMYKTTSQSSSFPPALEFLSLLSSRLRS